MNTNNNYLWQKFNIKTFPSETVVYQDGVFRPELSTLDSLNIDKKYDLPVHIIYIGEIEGEKNIDINISIPDTDVFMIVKIKNLKPAFLNINVKNTGKNSNFNGMVIINNGSVLNIKEYGINSAENTGVFIKNRIIAQQSSETVLTGIAEISKNCKNCGSDIGFSVLAAKDAKIKFMPAQMISSAPLSAEHSASIYRGTNHQIEYLKSSGLSVGEIKKVLEEAFINYEF